MKKLLLMKTVLLLCALVVGSMNGWADTSTVTASKITSSSVSWTGTAGETWSVSVNGGATNQNVTNGYAQVGTSSSPSTSITISTSGISGTISKIVVNCAAYQGKASISATVGGSAFGTQNQSIPSWSSSTGGDKTFSGSASGAIVITMTNGSGGRAMYIKSITVTYSTGSSSEPSVSLSTSSIDATVAEKNGTINVTYNNLTEYISDVFFCESDGTTSATYDWLEAEIKSTDITKLDYAIDANTGAARTAYMRVYVVDNNSNEYYSPIITITQAAKTVNLPTFNLSTGTFLEGTAIELSSDEDGNTIRYNITTNGTEPSTPTKTTGTLYESPIILSGNCTTKIKAIAVDAYGNVSNATTRSYTVVEKMISQLWHASILEVLVAIMVPKTTALILSNLMTIMIIL